MFERHRDGAWMSLGLTLNSFQFSNPHSYNTLRQPIIMIKKSRNDFWFWNANAIEWWRWFHRIVRLPWRVTDGSVFWKTHQGADEWSPVLWRFDSAMSGGMQIPSRFMKLRNLMFFFISIYIYIYMCVCFFFEVSNWSLSSWSIFLCCICWNVFTLHHKYSIYLTI